MVAFDRPSPCAPHSTLGFGQICIRILHEFGLGSLISEAVGLAFKGGVHRAVRLDLALLARRPTKVAAIALANKLARMAWAMMARGERYREPIALAA